MYFSYEPIASLNAEVEWAFVLHLNFKLEMAKHNVYFELPSRELGKADAKFWVYSDGAKIGEITISRGAFEYKPFKKQRKIKLGWKAFDRLMTSDK